MKTTIKKAQLGDILPEHKTGEEMKNKIKQKDNNVKSISLNTKIFKEGDDGYLEIDGSKAKIHK